MNDLQIFTSIRWSKLRYYGTSSLKNGIIKEFMIYQLRTRFLVKLSFIFNLFAAIFTNQLAYGQVDFQKTIQQIPKSSKFTDPGYYVWCGTMTQGDDGKYYLFYSRWPQKEGFKGWVTHSEIALAVSDKVTGQFKPKKVILGPRTKGFWDSDVTHNPNIQKFDGKYYLYYMGNYGNGEWWDHRNHQRIGVAVATSPLGPWQRFDKPVVDVSVDKWDHLMTSNPTVCKGKNGQYLLMYKGVGNGEMPFGGKVLHGVAFSNSPVGPFVKSPNPIFQKEGVKFPAEDPFAWYQDHKYWAIVKDMHSVFIESPKDPVLNKINTHPDSLSKAFENKVSLVLFESSNGTDWKLAKKPLVSKSKLNWEDGSVQQVQLLDRPQLYIEKGKPKVLLCAVKVSEDETFNVTIPLSEN